MNENAVNEIMEQLTELRDQVNKTIGDIEDVLIKQQTAVPKKALYVGQTVHTEVSRSKVVETFQIPESDELRFITTALPGMVEVFAYDSTQNPNRFPYKRSGYRIDFGFPDDFSGTIFVVDQQWLMRVITAAFKDGTVKNAAGMNVAFKTTVPAICGWKDGGILQVDPAHLLQFDSNGKQTNAWHVMHKGKIIFLGEVWPECAEVIVLRLELLQSLEFVALPENQTLKQHDDPSEYTNRLSIYNDTEGLSDD